MDTNISPYGLNHISSWCRTHLPTVSSMPPYAIKHISLCMIPYIPIRWETLLMVFVHILNARRYVSLRLKPYILMDYNIYPYGFNHISLCCRTYLPMISSMYPYADKHISLCIITYIFFYLYHTRPFLGLFRVLVFFGPL